MARLIDADKMKLEVNNENPIVVYYSKEIEEWRDNQPTVKAIPIEWIYKWLENIPNNQRGYSEDWNYNIEGEVKKIIYKNNTVILLPCITDMLDDWMEENK